MISEQDLKFIEDHNDKLIELIKGGVFETRNGQAIINFDNEGNIREIEIKQVVYKRKHANS